LLDVDLVELVLGLPPELAFDARLSRPLLRESVRGLIPEEVRLRPTKSSFDELFSRTAGGTRSGCCALAGARLRRGGERVRGSWSCARRALRRVPAQHTLRTAGWALGVWRLATAELWLRHRAGRPLED
jgi:hypothetical protein